MALREKGSGRTDRTGNMERLEMNDVHVEKRKKKWDYLRAVSTSHCPHAAVCGREIEAPSVEAAEIIISFRVRSLRSPATIIF